MAYSHAEITANEIAWAAADKPLWGALTGLTFGDVEWRTVKSFSGGSSLTDTDYPENRALDGFPHLVTRPSSAGTDAYLLFDWAANPITFDAVCFLGHNFGSLTTPTVTFGVADNSTFTTNDVTLGTSSSWTTKRKGFLSIFHTGSVARRYTDVPHGWVRVQTGASEKPEIGEVLFIRRRQFQFKPLRPYNPKATFSQTEHTRSLSGVSTKYVHNFGGRRLEASVRIISGDPDMESGWADGRYGARPFAWVEDPSSSPDDFHLMSYQEEEPLLDLQDIGPTAEDLTLSALEQGPTYLAKE